MRLQLGRDIGVVSANRLQHGKGDLSKVLTSGENALGTGIDDRWKFWCLVRMRAEKLSNVLKHSDYLASWQPGKQLVPHTVTEFIAGISCVLIGGRLRDQIAQHDLS